MNFDLNKDLRMGFTVLKDEMMQEDALRPTSFALSGLLFNKPPCRQNCSTYQRLLK